MVALVFPSTLILLHTYRHIKYVNDTYEIDKRDRLNSFFTTEFKLNLKTWTI